MQFQLPGTPLFPVQTDGLILKPTLRWLVNAERPANIPSELDYITHGLDWHATYNVIVPETSESTATELADLLGWVTINNKTGADFPSANIELHDGQVKKLPEMQPAMASVRSFAMAKALPSPAPQ